MKYFLLVWVKQWSIAFIAKIHVTPEKQGCIFVYKHFAFSSVKPTRIDGPGISLLSIYIQCAYFVLHGVSVCTSGKAHLSFLPSFLLPREFRDLELACPVAFCHCLMHLNSASNSPLS